jgi:hypothetical protein
MEFGKRANAKWKLEIKELMKRERESKARSRTADTGHAKIVSSHKLVQGGNKFISYAVVAVSYLLSAFCFACTIDNLASCRSRYGAYVSQTCFYNLHSTWGSLR